jgi:branched-chain amino acid transport system ATP-binding protein
VLSGFVRAQRRRCRSKHAFAGHVPARQVRFGCDARSRPSRSSRTSVWDNVQAMLDHVPHARANGGGRGACGARAPACWMSPPYAAHDWTCFNRMVEVAKALVGGPRLILSQRTGCRPRRGRVAHMLPGDYEHSSRWCAGAPDRSRRRSHPAICTQTLVLDFGRRLPSADARRARDRAVRQAYLGTWGRHAREVSNYMSRGGRPWFTT